MGITIPFAFNITPTSGAAADGVIHGVLPQVAPVSALSQVHLATTTKVFRGNAAADGSITYTEVTAAANNDTAGDVSIFDTANPTQDILCIELDAGDVISGISLLVSTAAAVVGTPVADVRYRVATGWANAVGVVTPSLTSTGLKKVTFFKSTGPNVELGYSDITLIDHLIDPFTQPQMRCVFLRFTGITSVTTAPLFTRIWKNISHDTEHKSTNFTALVSQGANPDFSGVQASVLPVDDDLSLFGFDEKPVRLFPTIYRPSDSAHVKEWVYSKADGSFAAVSATNINDPSTRLEAALNLNPTAHQRRNFLSTYTGAVWGNSGVASVETLAGNGYVEFRVGATPSLAGFVGFSTSDTNLTYTSIGWGYHIGHAGTALASAWVLGTQQTASGTWSIATGDVLRLERKAGVFTMYQNGTLRHTFTQTSTAAVIVDLSFIAQCSITDFILVNTAAIPVIPITLTWTSNTAVTITNGGTQQFGVATTHHVPLIPPSDWGKTPMTDTADIAHNRYWIGLRTTVDTTSPVLPANFTLRGQPIKGTGVEGVPAPETATYTKLTVIARDVATQESKILVVNGTTGAVVSVTVPANDPLAVATVSLPVTKDDLLLVVQATGAGASTLADGAVLLS